MEYVQVYVGGSRLAAAAEGDGEVVDNCNGTYTVTYRVRSVGVHSVEVSVVVLPVLRVKRPQHQPTKLDERRRIVAVLPPCRRVCAASSGVRAGHSRVVIWGVGTQARRILGPRRGFGPSDQTKY